MTEAHRQSPITAILNQLQDGNPGAADRLARAVMEDVRNLAARAVMHESDGFTLQATEVADEAIMRLLGMNQMEWQNRAQFFAIAVQTIRRILVDHARHRGRQKREGGVRITLDQALSPTVDSDVDVLDLNDALEQLERLAPRQAQVVALRYFGGFDINETAELLELSSATVKRDWTFARAFLLRILSGTSHE